MLLTQSFPGVDCEDLSPVKNEESILEGNSVTLTYKYSKTATFSDEFYWYRQYPGKPPEFLISHYGTQNASNHRLFVEAHGEKVQAQMSSAAVSDSAVYYCAVRPTRDSHTFSPSVLSSSPWYCGLCNISEGLFVFVFFPSLFSC
uniref:Ig-like domain-containing protein n=1 Tax=Sphaeramia orbicularis TaxID=375764 RepID=A0A673BU96_9TELE